VKHVIIMHYQCLQLQSGLAKKLLITSHLRHRSNVDLCVMQPGELFTLIHCFIKDLEQAMWEVAAAERAASRAVQKPSSPFLLSPSPSPSQISEPHDQQAKDSVIKQMQAFCSMSPGDRRATLNEAGKTNKAISEKVLADRPYLPKSFPVSCADSRDQRSLTVCRRFLSSVATACSFNSLFAV
jgi:hypothetical protein